jgi:hypothetical protein
MGPFFLPSEFGLYDKLLRRLADGEQRVDEAFCVAVALLFGKRFTDRFRR